MNTPKANEIYRHFKGNLYKVLTIARHSETDEDMVVYQALYGDYVTYVRPLDSFVSMVDKVKYPDATQEYRFEAVDVLNQNVTPVSSKAAADSALVTDKSEYEELEAESADEGTVNLNPLVEQFLDSDSLEEKKNILNSMRNRITSEDIAIMATVMDITIDDDLEVEEQYRQLLHCITTMGKYETNRLR